MSDEKKADVGGHLFGALMNLMLAGFSEGTTATLFLGMGLGLAVAALCDILRALTALKARTP